MGIAQCGDPSVGQIRQETRIRVIGAETRKSTRRLNFQQLTFIVVTCGRCCGRLGKEERKEGLRQGISMPKE
jgi:hypothetical protein